MEDDKFAQIAKSRWPYLFPINPISIEQALFEDDLKEFITSVLQYMEDANRRIYNIEQKLAEVRNGIHSKSPTTTGSSDMV